MTPSGEGARLGPYLLGASLGSGGMGEVFRARDTRLGRDVAIKILPTEVAGDADRLRRFEQEARAAAALNHPNIMSVHDVGHDNGVAYLVTELLEGQTLRAALAEPLSIDRVLDYAAQIADGLAAAHARGIVHRDIKPENLFVTSDGRVKILDFGLAKVLNPDVALADLDATALSPADTASGMILGTVGYMAPEYIRGQAVDARTDIFAFGCVLYEMLAGRRPFESDTAVDTISAILKDAPAPFAAAPPRASIPPAIARIVLRCLEKLPDARFQTASDLAFALRSVQPATRASDDPTASIAKPSVRPGRRLVAALVIVASLLGASVLLWKLGAAFGSPQPRVTRLAVSIPDEQAFVDVAGTALQLTPDGLAVVYSGRGPRGSQLYYRRLDQMEGRVIGGTDNAFALEVSPSGEWVAFQTEAASGGASVSKVALGGGLPILLGTVDYGGGIAWGPDGEIVAGTDFGLFRFPAGGGEPQQPWVTNEQHYMPLPLPGGRMMLVWDMVMVDVASGARTKLDGDGMNPIGYADGFLLFGRRDGTLGVVRFDPDTSRSVQDVIPIPDAPMTRPTGGMLAELSSRGDLIYARRKGGSILSVFDTQGRVLREAAQQRTFKAPRLSPDGRRVVMTEQLLSGTVFGDLWLYDLESEELRRLTTGVKASSPEWTFDGHVVFATSPRTGVAEAWRVPADGSGPAAMFLDIGRQVINTVLSPDGRYAVVDAFDTKTSRDLLLVSLGENRTPKPFAASEFNETMPAVSPDGRWLAYVSDESGHAEVYARPFPVGAERVQVSSGGGSEPRWTPDGGGIVYRNVNEFMKADLAFKGGLTVARRQALFVGQTPASAVLTSWTPEFDLLADGTIITTRAAGEAEIIVVTNWLAELKAKVGKR